MPNLVERQKTFFPTLANLGRLTDINVKEGTGGGGELFRLSFLWVLSFWNLSAGFVYIAELALLYFTSVSEGTRVFRYPTCLGFRMRPWSSLSCFCCPRILIANC